MMDPVGNILGKKRKKINWNMTTEEEEDYYYSEEAKRDRESDKRC